MKWHRGYSYRSANTNRQRRLVALQHESITTVKLSPPIGCYRSLGSLYCYCFSCCCNFTDDNLMMARVSVQHHFDYFKLEAHGNS